MKVSDGILLMLSNFVRTITGLNAEISKIIEKTSRQRKESGWKRNP